MNQLQIDSSLVDVRKLFPRGALCSEVSAFGTNTPGVFLPFGSTVATPLPPPSAQAGAQTPPRPWVPIWFGPCRWASLRTFASFAGEGTAVPQGLRVPHCQRWVPRRARLLSMGTEDKDEPGPLSRLLPLLA